MSNTRSSPKSAQDGDLLVVYPSANPSARIRLFCFPFAGGTASGFSTWTGRLPANVREQVELCAIRLPGRESRLSEPPFYSLPHLLNELAHAISRYSGKPMVFFGHSMGALVGFELARHLRRNGNEGPVHLIVSGHRAPQLPDRQPPIHQLRDREFMCKLRTFGGTPEDVLRNSELMELLLPALRADFAICENYFYFTEALLGCSITALGGLDDPRVNRAELTAWSAQTSRAFAAHFFPGDHFFIHTAASSVLRVLGHELGRVLRRPM
jgi:medium-chain acyl-[acyl-carrier-protein] hydrolase